jgi:hypothetical protein
MQQDEEYDGQHDKNRRRRERNTEAHSKRAGKRKAREEQRGDTTVLPTVPVHQPEPGLGSSNAVTSGLYRI